MISFAEEIAYLYYTHKNYLTFRNFNYLYASEEKVQPGNTDIDLIAYRENEFLIISCKRGALNENQEKKELKLFKSAKKIIKKDENFGWIETEPQYVYIAEFITEHNKKFFEKKNITVLKLSVLISELLLNFKKTFKDTKRVGKEINILPRILKNLIIDEKIHWLNVRRGKIYF